jgi:hypothetical protein
MWKPRWLPGAGIVLALAAVPLQAHHSLSAEYKTSVPIELRGTVTRVDWINPHTFIHLDVARPDGTHETWQVEAGSPSTLVKAKVSREMIAVGTQVVIKAFRANNGSTRASGSEITFADGAKHLLEMQPEPKSLTLSDWVHYSLPSLINNWMPFVVMGLPVAVLVVGLFLLRSRGKKARV